MTNTLETFLVTIIYSPLSSWSGHWHMWIVASVYYRSWPWNWNHSLNGHANQASENNQINPQKMSVFGKSFVVGLLSLNSAKQGGLMACGGSFSFHPFSISSFSCCYSSCSCSSSSSVLFLVYRPNPHADPLPLPLVHWDGVQIVYIHLKCIWKGGPTDRPIHNTLASDAPPPSTGPFPIWSSVWDEIWMHLWRRRCRLRHWCSNLHLHDSSHGTAINLLWSVPHHRHQITSWGLLLYSVHL